MTNEECVKILRQVKDGDLLTFDKNRRKALDMAIETMSNSPTRMSGTSDLISRQAAIDAINNHLRRTDVPASYPGIVSALTEWLNELPSVQPDSKESSSTHKTLDNNLPSAQPEIIHCRDCKHHWTHSCMDAFHREICDLDQTFYDSNFDYCSLAERRTDEQI